MDGCATSPCVWILGADLARRLRCTSLPVIADSTPPPFLAAYFLEIG